MSKEQYLNLKQRLERPKHAIIDNMNEHLHPHNVRGEIPEINDAKELKSIFGLHNKPQRIICLATAYEMLLEEELKYDDGGLQGQEVQKLLPRAIDILYRSLNEDITEEAMDLQHDVNNLEQFLRGFGQNVGRDPILDYIIGPLDNFSQISKGNLEVWINIGRVAVALEEFYPEDPDRSDKYKDKFYQEFYKRVACKLAFVDAQTAHLE